jgi:hypothetical protein
MASHRIQKLGLSIFLFFSLNGSAFAETGSLEPKEPVGSSCNGPECFVLAGVLLALSGIDGRPATAQKMDSMSDSLVVFCKQEGTLPDMSFPCGPTEVEIVNRDHRQSLNFRGGKIVIPQLNEEDTLTLFIRARGCKETQIVKEAKSRDVVTVQLSATCTK